MVTEYQYDGEKIEAVFETIEQAIEEMDDLDEHVAYSIRAGSASAANKPPGIPSVTTSHFWFALGEEPEETHQPRCSCGKEHSSWCRATKCPTEPKDLHAEAEQQQ